MPQTFKLVSVNLLGSRLYGLENASSDYDYLVLYRKQPEDYICFGEYKDFMPPTTLEGSFPVNYKYWDIKKFLFLAGKSSFGALEVLYAFDAYTDHYRTHIEKIFKAKRNGVKDMPFIVESYGDDAFKEWPKVEIIDYTSVLHKCIFDFK